jgi:DNA-binding MurR/RpiR family transcriptional regulator
LDGAVEQGQDILAVIRDRLPALPRNQKRVAEYVLKNQQSIAFSTVTELAEQTGISPATIVRFAKSLGFEGYNGLQREMRRTMRAELRGPERFRRARKPDRQSESALSPAIEQELGNIAALQDYHDPQTLATAVRAVSDASRIAVLGSRSTASLANHFWFALNKAGLPAERVLTIDTHAYELVRRLDDAGCVVLIGFPRYLNELGDILEFATEVHKRTVVITDSPFSPFKGDVTLYAPVESSSFIAFHSAPFILISTLMSEIAADRPERTLDALDRFEELAERQELFRPARPGE